MSGMIQEIHTDMIRQAVNWGIGINSIIYVRKESFYFLGLYIFN